jgi:hypothetical protein
MSKDNQANVQDVESSELNTTPKSKADALEYDVAYKKRLVRKIDMHGMPLCAFIYLLSYLDRCNIGNVRF